MSAERWRMVEKLYHEALEVPASGRRAFLERAAGGDQELRREVEALLAVEDDTTGILNSDAAGWLARGQDWRPEPGTMLGPYRLDSLLGFGGMALVYRALDTRLDRQVAVKIVGLPSESDEVAQQRLLREARTASALHHPNICTIFDVGESDGRVFIAMELVNGRPLKELIPPDGLAAEVVVDYAIQIAEALDHAHRRTVIHRDLKSANVMVTEEGTIKVFDFGIARKLNSDAGAGRQTLTQAGLITGTPAYMAPELLRGEPPTRQTDLWAAGVLLYEALTGQLPFTGPTTVALAAAILNDTAAPMAAKAPPRLAAIIRRCLEKDPSRRYAYAAEIKDDLKALAPRPALLGRRVWITAGAGSAAAVGFGAWFGRERLFSPTRLSSGGFPSLDAEANELAEQAWAKLSTHTDLKGAFKLLARALLLDAGFAEARALLAFAYFVEIESGESNNPGLLRLAASESRNSIGVDSRCARAWSTLAAVLLYQGRKDQALVTARRAIEISPKLADGFYWLGSCYTMDGDYEQALSAFRTALRASSTFFIARIKAADTLFRQGKRAESFREIEGPWFQPEHPSIRKLRIPDYASGNLRDLAVARRFFLRAAGWKTEKVLSTNNYQIRLAEALTSAAEGSASVNLDQDLLQYASLISDGPLLVAEIYATAGDVDRALDWLERAVRAGDAEADWFRRNPQLASLQSHPRFRQIVESIESSKMHRGR